jgi:hypothetical protein
MAIEYTLQSDADLTSGELHSFFASAVGGDTGIDGTVFRPGMYVVAFRPPDDERDETTRLFGFEHRITVTFRYANLAGSTTDDQNTAAMVSAVLGFHGHFNDHGVLLFNGDVAVIQWSPDGIVFDSEWEDWFEVEPVIPLVTGHRIQRLAQPLL